ncbi:Glyoxylate/hydroxypyruvate reductase HPR3 [Quillaja saponaria]|uniref:Glyoxylate/hydroxypyruvate reductase HPR3 n=1 Tax=Quillaja saponaria TaxID=32244 RepID=A0AAD7PNN7_QUISA|nr:Glyoxylate/hydroxypyruvate reductase HPR3 [Quillaja saponaria]
MLLNFAATSNALVICCVFTEQTHHLINKQVMLALGREGVIVNIGRGALIDEIEMLQCSIEGNIGGAGLDVFENEPDVLVQCQCSRKRALSNPYHLLQI